MTERSARFGLPFILPGQAQKEAFHNEALAALDGLVHSAVSGVASAPPAEPAEGEGWVVAAGASGSGRGRKAGWPSEPRADGDSWCRFPA